MKQVSYTFVKRCESCGKMCFTSRKAAKKYVTTHFRSDPQTVYRCDGNPEYFHFGHTPQLVARGVKRRGATTAARQR